MRRRGSYVRRRVRAPRGPPRLLPCLYGVRRLSRGCSPLRARPHRQPNVDEPLDVTPQVGDDRRGAGPAQHRRLGICDQIGARSAGRMMCRKCGRRVTHRLRPRSAASSPYMAGKPRADRDRLTSDRLLEEVPRREGTPLWGLRDQRLLARVRRLLARCRAIALRSNGMSTQRASICPRPRRGPRSWS